MKWYEYFTTIGGMIIVGLGIGLGVYINYALKANSLNYNGFISAGVTALFILVGMISYINTANKRKIN